MGRDMGMRGRAGAVRIGDFDGVFTVTGGNASPHGEEDEEEEREREG